MPETNYSPIPRVPELHHYSDAEVAAGLDRLLDDINSPPASARHSTEDCAEIVREHDADFEGGRR